MNYSTEQVEMLCSDLSISVNRKLGFLNKRAIDMSKLLYLSKDIYKQYTMDNKTAKIELHKKLNLSI